MDWSDTSNILVRRGAGLIEAEMDGEIVGLHIGNGMCYGFNATATRTWQLIEQPRSFAEICAALAEEFEVDPATCEADVRDLLQDLSSDGIVIISESGDPR
ncbi:PqqD family protein [Sphingomonas sp.]|uniref:PqqD family protein n=1 Tax=Sphingomonas sp. TaxID=28214 RepID=UPI002E32F42D|nr:PqqD family protein [Sphingomonas sp.]HEX4694082.1 PqqD family protein [Sphingomonas sp.]